MKVSVIIPAYNTDKTIEKTVNSIERCGLQDYEIIIVDDGSTDGTTELCEQLSKTTSYIHCFHQANKGVSAARNHGLAKAKGEYVWFFDSDDLVDPGSMEYSQLILEEKKPDLLMFGMSFDYYYRERIYERQELYYDVERSFTSEELKAEFSELHHNNMIMPCWNKIIRRSILIENKIWFDTDLFSMEDFHFSLNLLECCDNVYVIPAVIYRFIQHERSSPKRGGRDNQRMAKIHDAAEYMKHFEPFLRDHPEVLLECFFTILREKLSKKRPEEMTEIAESFLSCPYHNDASIQLYSTQQKKLAMHLEKHEFQALYKQFRKERRKKQLVVLIKRTPLYKLIRGTRSCKTRF